MIKLGNTEIKDIKLGSTDVQKVMLGTTLIWERPHTFTLTITGSSSEVAKRIVISDLQGGTVNSVKFIPNTYTYTNTSGVRTTFTSGVAKTYDATTDLTIYPSTVTVPSTSNTGLALPWMAGSLVYNGTIEVTCTINGNVVTRNLIITYVN